MSRPVQQLAAKHAESKEVHVRFVCVISVSISESIGEIVAVYRHDSSGVLVAEAKYARRNVVPKARQRSHVRNHGISYECLKKLTSRMCP